MQNTRTRKGQRFPADKRGRHQITKPAPKVGVWPPRGKDSLKEKDTGPPKHIRDILRELGSNDLDSSSIRKRIFSN